MVRSSSDRVVACVILHQDHLRPLLYLGIHFRPRFKPISCDSVRTKWSNQRWFCFLYQRERRPTPRGELQSCCLFPICGVVEQCQHAFLIDQSPTQPSPFALPDRPNRTCFTSTIRSWQNAAASRSSRHSSCAWEHERCERMLLKTGGDDDVSDVLCRRNPAALILIQDSTSNSFRRQARF